MDALFNLKIDAKLIKVEHQLEITKKKLFGGVKW